MPRKSRESKQSCERKYPLLKIDIEVIKKAGTEGILEKENLSKQIGSIHVSIANRIEEMEERISAIVKMIEEIDSLMNENVKYKNVTGVPWKILEPYLYPLYSRWCLEFRRAP